MSARVKEGASRSQEGIMSYVLRTILNPSHRKELFARFERLDPSRTPLWGRLTAPSMVVHLCDHMRMPFSDTPITYVPGVPSFRPMRSLILYVLPWPKAQIQGPPEAFVTQPGNWSDDLATLKES